VLDADIAKCFDQIDHEALLTKLNTFPTLRRQVKAWLKAGVIDWNGHANRDKSRTVDSTLKGTPQGGVISPLLANIALHGMETTILGAFPKRNAPNIIRYADDFVVLHENLTVVKECQQIVAEWLKGMSLELKPSKTRISHTLQKYEGNVGFDFLGFNIRQHPVGKYKIFAVVDARGTSQECPECKGEVKKDLSVRVHDCPHCGYKTDRDVASGQVIRNRGIEQISTAGLAGCDSFSRNHDFMGD
jgi:ribosomal protein L37AE/L43A